MTQAQTEPQPQIHLDDWKVEYEQLSEDNRHFTTMGWESIIAVVVGDALIVAPALSVESAMASFALCSMAAILTILIDWEIYKWAKKGRVAIERLKELGRQHGFKRMPDEKGFLLQFQTARLVQVFLLVVAIGLFSLGLLLGAGYHIVPVTPTQ